MKYAECGNLTCEEMYHFRRITELFEVDFNEIKGNDSLAIYPEANKEWYKKWKKENPGFAKRKTE